MYCCPIYRHAALPDYTDRTIYPTRPPHPNLSLVHCWTWLTPHIPALWLGLWTLNLPVLVVPHTRTLTTCPTTPPLALVPDGSIYGWLRHDGQDEKFFGGRTCSGRYLPLRRTFAPPPPCGPHTLYTHIAVWPTHPTHAVLLTPFHTHHTFAPRADCSL